MNNRQLYQLNDYLFGKILLSLFVVLLFLISPTCAQNILDGNKPIQAKIVSDFTSFQPTEDTTKPVARIGVLFSIKPGWHIYWQNSGQAAIPTKVTWTLPNGWKTSPIRWPAPTKFHERADIITYGYSNETLLLADIFAPAIIPDEKNPITIEANVNWLICKDLCVPGNVNLKRSFLFSTSEPLEASAERILFEKYDTLSPKTFAELHLLNDFQGTSVEVLATNINSETQATVSVTGFPSKKTYNLWEKIQIFPFANSNIITGEPFLSPSKSQEQFTITIPIKLSDKPRAGNSTLAGIITFSSDLTNTKEDFSALWSLPLKIETKDSKFYFKTPETSTTALTNIFPLIRYPLVYRSKNFNKELNKNISNDLDLNLSEFFFTLFTAFLGGMLLNLMPCVLPIISIKVMSFVGYSGRPRKEVIESALIFSLGILTSFTLLALAIIGLQTAGHQLGWGFQFQYPAFVFLLLVIVFSLSLSFFELYNFSLPGVQSANKVVIKLHMPLLKHFFDGILATALSTPCTAPFLGTALAFAFAQSPVIVLTTFLAIGAGLAFPYLLLSSNKKLLSFLPKPGPWMFTFKKIMGLMLLLTTGWLLYILDRQTEQGLIWALLFLMLIWISLLLRRYLIKNKIFNSGLLVTNILFFSFLLFAVVKFWPAITTVRRQPLLSTNSKIAWQPYTEEALNNAHQQKQTVLIDFTADWCITCKANEFSVIETIAVAEAIQRNNILPLKADWTSGNQAITEALKKFAGQGVPHYVVFPGNSDEAIILDPILTQDALIKALKH